jgi:hypothetical protein
MKIKNKKHLNINEPLIKIKNVEDREYDIKIENIENIKNIDDENIENIDENIKNNDEEKEKEIDEIDNEYHDFDCPFGDPQKLSFAKKF